MIGSLGSPPTRKYACSECGARPSTVRIAATSACPITCPPNTRCQRSCGERPRNRFTSSCSRLSTSSMVLTAASDIFVARAVMAEQAGRRGRMSRRAALLRRDEAAILIRGEITGVDRIGERARFHVGERGAGRAIVERFYVDGESEISRLTNRFHSVEAGEARFVNPIELAE